MGFSETWLALGGELSAGMVIENWTAHRGVVGDPFRISNVSSNAIIVNAPKAVALQSVKRAEFEKIYDLWEDYTHGGIPRSTFNPLTRHSKYIISLLHWLQVRSSNNRLP